VLKNVVVLKYLSTGDF